MKKQSLWIDTSSPQDFPKLRGQVKVDVLVVGGGITGVTTAHLLKQAGCRVAVVDLKNIGAGETSHTTAHVTFVTDTRLRELVSRLGQEQSQALWGAGNLAMQQIEDTVKELEIKCELKRVPGYLFAALGKDASKESKSLQEDALISDGLGFDAAFIKSDPLFHRPAVRFPNELKFHPLKYVNAIGKALPGDDSDKHELRTDDGTISYDTVVAATHVPIQGERDTFGAALFQTKLAAYSTYALEAEIDFAAESLFWDTNDPYLYFRFDRRNGRSSVIIGGEDHKTGQEEDTEARYERLEKALMETHMGCIVTWNGAEKTWDCPCHGSRFGATGELIAGPAESNLEPSET